MRVDGGWWVRVDGGWGGGGVDSAGGGRWMVRVDGA